MEAERLVAVALDSVKAEVKDEDMGTEETMPVIDPSSNELAVKSE